MSLKARITEDMKAAMRSRDAARLSALRLLLASIKQREVDERRELPDADVLQVIDKMLKQRRDSIEQFERAKRQELANAEKFEVSVLQTYMPQALSEAEIAAEIAKAVAASGAHSLQDMSKVMVALKPALAGRADMAQVSALVKARLTG